MHRHRWNVSSIDSVVCFTSVLISRDTCSIELFQNMCGELRDWMSEKQSVLTNDDLGKDMRTVQALQRKHQVGGGEERGGEERRGVLREGEERQGEEREGEER